MYVDFTFKHGCRFTVSLLQPEQRPANVGLVGHQMVGTDALFALNGVVALFEGQDEKLTQPS